MKKIKEKIYEIKDENGRPLLVMKNSGNVAVARYPDMKETTKEMVIKLYGNMGCSFRVIFFLDISFSIQVLLILKQMCHYFY